MDNENKIDNVQLQESNVLQKLLMLTKRNVILILAVVILVTAIGVVFSLVRQPKYTATCKVVFYAEDLEAKALFELPDTDPKKITESDYNKRNVNIMNAFLFTVIDFCGEMVVLDRANYYYSLYLKEKENDASYTVDKFVSYINSLKGNDGYVFNEDAEWKEKYILQDNVDLSTSATTSDKVVYFSIGYEDSEEAIAIDKTTILTCAANREMQSIDYFAGVGAMVQPTGAARSTVDIGKATIVLIAFVLGVVLAYIVVFIKNAFDNTIKSREDLAQIIGAPVLASICDQEVLTNGR